MPQISIIVPVYQVESYLGACIDSILAQTFGDFELILVDDGSTDRSGRICDEYAEKDGRIRVLHRANAGAAAARNTGLAHAQAEYIVFADGDDWLQSNMLARMYETIRGSGYDLVVCNFRYVYPDAREDFSTELPDMELSGREVLSHWKAGKNFGVWTVVWNKIYTKKALEGLGFPEGKYFEDETFSDLLYSSCQHVRVIPEVLYAYRVHSGSTMNTQKAGNYLDLLDAFALRITLYLEQQLPVDAIYKILVFMLEPYSLCASAGLQGEDRQRLLDSRAFIQKTAKTLMKTRLSPVKKCSLPAIGLLPGMTFRTAIRFRGLLETFL